jgi:hypothetical protein
VLVGIELASGFCASEPLGQIESWQEDCCEPVMRFNRQPTVGQTAMITLALGSGATGGTTIIPISLFSTRPWAAFNQGSDQAKKSFVLRMSLARAQEGADINIGHPLA